MPMSLKTILMDLMKQRNEVLTQKNKPEYHQRHIVSLKAVSKWDRQEEAIQKQHNRILQPGYSDLQPDEIISIAKITKEEWLTNFVCPKVENACKLNIAADLITQFKVSSEDLNSMVQKIYLIITSDGNLLKEIAAEIENKMNELNSQIEKNARENMEKRYPGINNPDIFEKFKILENQRVKKEITHSLLKKKLALRYPEVVKQLNIQIKPVYDKGKNVDYSILGAAGSGKSTITNNLISQDKTDFIVLATDDYRGVSLEEAHEKTETDQIFTRTQDTAYSIKELVQERLTTANTRSNVILDCVSLEQWHRELLENNQETISAVACLDDISLVPLRAYNRAISSTSGPADKGRQVHTSSLLKGHANASLNLLTGIPLNVKTNLFDTNIPKGEKPPVLAVIDTTQGKHQIEILNLEKFSKFLAKTNVNKRATYKGDLYYKKEENYGYMLDSQYCAEQILKLITASFPKKSDNYDIILHSKEGNVPYVKIFINANKIQLEVLNKEKLLEILNKSKPGGEDWLLKNMIMQIYFGSLSAVRKQIKTLGRDKALSMALENVIPDVTIPQLSKNRTAPINEPPKPPSKLPKRRL